MANIMIRRGAAGEYVFYLPKRDLEDTIVSMEFDHAEKWGGEIKLNNGGAYYIDPCPRRPGCRFPCAPSAWMRPNELRTLKGKHHGTQNRCRTLHRLR